jgi:hypothetical protein
LLAITVVTGIAAGTASSSAQPARDHRPPPPPVERDHRAPPAPPAADYPREAPPPPHVEKFGARAGYVWAGGRWDWRAGKWEWMPGHWEHEQPGRRWNPARWDHQGDRWVLIEGGWVDGGPPPPAPAPTPAPPPPPAADYPREAPPPPRAEKFGVRAGYVWAAGRWDWRAGKWEWMPGHWEHEQPGRRWNPARWDHQGDRWVLVEGNWGDGAAVPPGPPPVNDDRPHQPPPPPRDEHIGARAGYVWAHGRWDWRAGKWEWMPGHWEHAQPGRQWREASWELRDGAYVLVDGTWIDTSAPPPPASGEPGPPPGPDDHPREWKLDRPVISSYWPVKGKIGSRIVIRGRNFPGDTMVMWNGTQIAGAKVEPERIVVAVPQGATSGLLSLRAGRHRELMVGNFEVADYDAAAEAQRQADAERRQAEQAWAERQKQLAKDRTARLAAIDQHHRELDASREQRREDRERQIRAQWDAAFLADPDTQAELTLHAQRVAELTRMREVAELSENSKLVVRIGVAQSREDDRHQSRMTALHGTFGRKP